MTGSLHPAMEQQAWILRSFVAQLERQEAGEQEAQCNIAGEFARLKSQSTRYRTDKTFPTKTAEKQENMKKNRYKDIVPFDHSRVKLTFTTSKNDTDYINASFIKGMSGSRAYIATQGPLPHTVIDFLRMIWEYDMKVIVMACREFEMGKKKCECYWPQKQEQPFVCEPFSVYCDSEENKGDYLTRTLRITYRNCSRTLKQLHYVNWPDHGVPDSIPPILDMLQEMRSYQAHDDVPICIHCSAGCGRTGALCVIDYTWNLLKKQMIPPDFSIFDLVQNMRTQRPSVVQTKEQYELVYRTIKLLFVRYLHSMDTQTRENEVTVVPSAITPDTDSELSDLSEDLELQTEFQNLLEAERDLMSYQPSLPSASDNYTDIKTGEKPRGDQQWHLFQTFPEAASSSRDLQERPCYLGATGPSPRPSTRSLGEDEKTLDIDNIPSLHRPPSPDVAAAICLMVEDPYFDTPMSSPSSEEAPIQSPKDENQWPVNPVLSTPVLSLNDQTCELSPSPPSGTYSDEEAPPPLPERTPESYVLAETAESSDRLAVVIPPNAAAHAVRELGGSPPSPVPPLPERTPESFELAADQAPVEQKVEVAPVMNLSIIGKSSEWSGTSHSASSVAQNETKSWVRSKSLRAKMTFTALPEPKRASTKASKQHPHSPGVDPPAALLVPQDKDTPPLPDRTPESFILTTENSESQGKNTPCPQPFETPQPSKTFGTSSEWDGTSQPKTFLDVVKSRSKSVRIKGSGQGAHSVSSHLAPPPVVVAGGGSAQVGLQDVNHRSSLNNEVTGNKSDKSNEKSMSRTKSLKFFRHKHKGKIDPPPPPTQPQTPPPSYGATFSVFKLGFGSRFGKPKGPRSYPETWV
ncbi:tyrosine-protein phosphatase non-receptor type 22 isoform X2 [Sphaeramia orbicularis]|uniref:tyrosine-protein phosphatase non-receptor type 22 isoform X2 n=1 Tax=Sphaeramia orbicularis TaxID=375764 RepID=UPI00118015E6|nr:tyrosine-protein phosphatase non-receptor type 22-like isoform X2 [Sphaeramia orbicularis]